MVDHVHKKGILTRLFFYKMIKRAYFINWSAEALLICNTFCCTFDLFFKKPTILDILIVALHLPRGLQLILNKDASSFDFIYLLLDYKCNSIYMYMFFFSFKSSWYKSNISMSLEMYDKWGCISVVWWCCPFLLHFCW